MKVQHSVLPTNQHVTHKKPEAKDKVPQQDVKTEEHDKLKKFGLAANQQLFIGAKTLMATLNKQLKLDSSFSLSMVSNYSIELKTEQSSLLDKIEIEPITFDFEAVAKNVMEFVTSVIKGAQAGGASDDKLNEMLEQARSGVDKGFEMARDDLGGMNMLTDDVKQGMDKSYDLIQQGISDLNDELFNIEQTSPSQSIAMSEQEQGSIEITTRDGDSIKINFASDINLQYSQTQQDGRLVSEFSFSDSRSFNMEVTGNLDKDELKAVAHLVKDIGKLANDFFNGDIEKAWQQANKLDFDQQQIAQYALDFQEVKQVAIKENYISGNSTASPIATLSPYLKDLNDVMEQSIDLFSGNNLKELMQGVAQQQLDLSDSLMTQTAESFVTFNQQLQDALR